MLLQFKDEFSFGYKIQFEKWHNLVAVNLKV
jgi:hypothetical protein